MEDNDLKKNYSGACGIYCGICPLPCSGCGCHEGGAFWCETFGPCPLHTCCRLEKEISGCERCAEFPCGKLLEMTFDVNHPESRDRLALALLRHEMGVDAWVKRMEDYFGSLRDDEG